MLATVLPSRSSFLVKPTSVRSASNCGFFVTFMATVSSVTINYAETVWSSWSAFGLTIRHSVTASFDSSIKVNIMRLSSASVSGSDICRLPSRLLPE